MRQPFQLRSRSREAGNVIETHEHAGEFKEWWALGAWNKKPPRGEAWRLIAETLRARLYGLLNFDTAPSEKLLNEIRASEDIHSAQVIQL